MQWVSLCYRLKIKSRLRGSGSLCQMSVGDNIGVPINILTEGPGALEAGLILQRSIVRFCFVNQAVWLQQRQIFKTACNG